MSSRILYPPTLDSYMPAFIHGKESKCKITFSLSKFNTAGDFKNVQAVVLEQRTGLSVVNKTKPKCTTGIILDITPSLLENGLYQIEIPNDYIINDIGADGWKAGWIYKIQIRLSNVTYGSSTEGEANWLNANAQEFSEWSTMCIVKVIGANNISIPSLRYPRSGGTVDKEILYLSTIDLAGTYKNEDSSEILYSYKAEVYESQKGLIESSDIFYPNEYDANKFRIPLKTEFEDGKIYTIKFYYTTINYYSGEIEVTFEVSNFYAAKINIGVYTVDTTDTNNPDIFKKYINESNGGHVHKEKNGNFTWLTTVEQEEEEGRVALKLYSGNTTIYNGNLCVRRTDSKSNFTEWVDIKTFALKNIAIKDIPIFYDYTIESGVWYKYGVQTIEVAPAANRKGYEVTERGILSTSDKAVLRNFEYSYLLGDNNQQLKLQFDNNISSFKIAVNDGKTDTIGGRYPFITRNGAMNYKTFPLTGTISFNMDENNLFITKEEIYKNKSIVEEYNNYNGKNNITAYNDFTYERDFRYKVLEFLQNDRPKLFKSPTEGNVVVRITDVNCTPNASLGRMIYSFSAVATEVAEANLSTYEKYGFYKLEDYATNFSDYEIRIGQLDVDLELVKNGKPVSVDLIDLIYQKYDNDKQEPDKTGYNINLKEITNVCLTVNEKPYKVYSDKNDETMGFRIRYDNGGGTGNKDIIIQNYYDFDSKIIFNDKSHSIVFYPPADGYINSDNSVINVTVDFLYKVEISPWEGRAIASKEYKQGIGQIYRTFVPGESVYKGIYYKHYAEWGNNFRYLNTIKMVEIEALPGAAFYVDDTSPTEKKGQDKHEMNWTGILNFSDLSMISDIKYAGMRMPDGNIDDTVYMDILVNYQYQLLTGVYK